TLFSLSCCALSSLFRASCSFLISASMASFFAFRASSFDSELSTVGFVAGAGALMAGTRQVLPSAVWMTTVAHLACPQQIVPVAAFVTRTQLVAPGTPQQGGFARSAAVGPVVRHCGAVPSAFVAPEAVTDVVPQTGQ